MLETTIQVVVLYDDTMTPVRESEQTTGNDGGDHEFG